MDALMSTFSNPWRAVPVLGLTQVLAWGAIYYTPVLIMPRIASEQGWSVTFTMGGFSGGLLIAGLCARRVGVLIDRHGGHWVMASGSLLGAAGLALLAAMHDPVVFCAAWVLLGAAMSASLYDPAFATLGRIFAVRARAPITALTLIGGLASTVSWPLTFWLLGTIGWRGSYAVYALALALVAAPLHAFALPRPRTAGQSLEAEKPVGTSPAQAAFGIQFALLAAAFTAYSFVPSGMSAHMLAMFARLGLDSATVVTVGALFGPAQVVARLTEFVFARRVHPLLIARAAIVLLTAAFAFLAVVGLSPVSVAIVTIAFGAANGLMTIARGTVPLALFGATGYGETVGRISRPTLLMQALAPVLLALVIERFSDTMALAALGAFAVVTLVCLALIRRPEGERV